MPETPQTADHRISTADLRRAAARRFVLAPEAPERADLAAALGISALRKLRFEGDLRPEGKSGWRLEAMLGATVVQPCVVTLDPVTTRIDQPVMRLFLPAGEIAMPEPGSEIEIPAEDEADPLGAEIDLLDIMSEALALALPSYPRKPEASLDDAVFAAEGTVPLTDGDLKPFAALEGFRARLSGAGGDGATDPGQDTAAKGGTTGPDTDDR